MPVPIGNVRTDSLREVWATSEVLEMLRDRSQYKEGAAPAYGGASAGMQGDRICLVPC